MQQVQKTVKTKSRKICSVPQCSSYCTDAVSLHKFPLQDRKLCKIWRFILKIGKPITQYMYVCSKHFVAGDFSTSLTKGPSRGKPRVRIKKTAIPSMNIPKSSHENLRTERRKLIRCNMLQTSADQSENSLNQVEDLVVQYCSDLEQMESSISPVEQLSEVIPNGDMELEPIESEPAVDNMVVETSTQTTQDTFQLPQLLNTDDRLRTFTGVDYKILLAYKKCVENIASANNFNLPNIEFSIILVLCKLKTNLSFACLALLFGISVSTCTRIFYTTVHLLAVSIKPVIYWPSKEEILRNLPKCFNKFKNTRIVLDCTEVKVQKLKCLNCRILSYSHYKRSHTVKFLIGITPSGLISFVSQGYGGRATDKAIFNRENLIGKFELNDGIMVDKGVLIDKECEENFLKLIRPPFLRKKKQLTKEDARLTADIARARVHVERAIERIKKFAILNDQIDWYLIPDIDDIMTIIAATVNMKSPLLADDKF